MVRKPPILITAFLAMVFVHSVVNCTPKRDSAVNGLPRPPGAPGRPGTPTPAGTSDSGGGTGVERRIFESYIVPDITKTRPFERYVKPLLLNIKPDDPAATSTVMDFISVFNMKTWYIAPVDLEKLSKESLGVSFFRSSTTQIARQTDMEIWIDKRIHDPLANEPNGDELQGDIYLHEFVMMLYYFKFKPLPELCRQQIIAGMQGASVEDCEKAAGEPSLRELLAPEPRRPLNEDDNKRIRAAVGWIKRNATTAVKESEFVKMLFLRGFDRRLFNPSTYGKQAEELPTLNMPGSQLLSLLEEARLTNHLPTHCHSLESDTKKPCRVSFEKVPLLVGNSESPAYRLRLSLEDVSGEIATVVNVGQEASLSPANDLFGNTWYAYTLLTYKPQWAVGDRAFIGQVIFKRLGQGSAPNLILESVVIKPVVVLSIHPQGYVFCRIRPPRPQGPWDQTILAKSSAAEPTWLEAVFLGTSFDGDLCAN